MRIWHSGRLGAVLAITAVTLGLGIALHPVAVDDAFITYRYAQNLVQGHGFVYNPGQPVLSTTAPLYALILAAGSLVWPDLPSLANALSALAVWAAAVVLFHLGRRSGMAAAGALAALLLAVSPLLWLSLGLETAVFLALALGAILAYERGRLYVTAVLVALTTLVRGDGVVLAAAIAADFALACLLRGSPGRLPRVRSVLRSLGRVAPGPVLVYALVLLPLAAWLTWQFGSPLPASLSAKQAQAELGVTGFYAHTTYLEGLWILVRARLGQSLLYLLFIPAMLAGLAVLRRAAWARPLVVWAVAHLISYSLLGVTPYYWYYAPLIPALACVSALGVVEGSRWATGRLGRGRQVGWVLGALWALALATTLLWSDLAMVGALEGIPPPPEDPVSKVLPEAKAGVYRRAGEWLREHTPEGALVGVTEVGVMGYYSGRPMLDFLGLLEPAVAEALARGDLYWALVYYQPDYLALTGVSPLYAYDLRGDTWFQAAYTPVQSFEDSRFWGSPLTVYRRSVPRMPVVASVSGELAAGATRLDADFAGQIRLVGALTGGGTVRPGEVLPLTLYWQALKPVPHDYTVFVHLLGQHDRVIAQRDAPPGLGAQPTSGWKPGQIITDPYLVALPEAAYAPDQAVWEIGLYEAQTGQRLATHEAGDSVRFGAVEVQPAPKPLDLDFGPLRLVGYELDRLALRVGEALGITLHWEPGLQGARPVQVCVELVGETGNVGDRADHLLAPDARRPDVYRLAVDGAPPGAYDLEVLVADAASGQALPLLGADGQPRSDRARLTKVRVYP